MTYSPVCGMKNTSPLKLYPYFIKKWDYELFLFFPYLGSCNGECNTEKKIAINIPNVEQGGTLETGSEGHEVS